MILQWDWRREGEDMWSVCGYGEREGGGSEELNSWVSLEVEEEAGVRVVFFIPGGFLGWEKNAASRF